jgi:hypothetical protein
MAAKQASEQVTAWLQSLRLRALADYRERNTLMWGLRRQRFLRGRVNPPLAYQDYLGPGVRVPITYRLIQTVVGAVAGENRPRFHVSGPDSEVNERAARWLRLVIQYIEQRHQPALYWRYWASLAGDGMAVLKTARRPWTGYPIRRPDQAAEDYIAEVERFFRSEAEPPFITRVVDPMTFYPPRSEWGVGQIAIEHGVRPYRSVLAALRLRPLPTGRLAPLAADEPLPLEMQGLSPGNESTVEVTEVWTSDACLVLVGADNAFVFDNELGRLPYLWTFATAEAFDDPLLQAVGPAFPLIYLEPWINQKLSELVGFSNLQTTPTPFVVHKDARGGGGEPEIVDFQAGRLHNFAGDVQVGTWDMGRPTEAIQVLATMIQLAKEFTISPVPAFAGTRTAGTVLAAAQERILSILRPMVDQAQATWGELARLYLHIVRHVIGAPVYVSGLTFDERGRDRKARLVEARLSPRDVERITNVAAEIDFKTVTDRIAWHTHNVMMAQSGLWSRRRAMLESDVEDPEREMHDIILEQLLQHPLVLTYILNGGVAGTPLEAVASLLQGQGLDLSALQGAAQPPAGEETARPTTGRVTGEVRAPGGVRRARAPKGRL